MLYWEFGIVFASEEFIYCFFPPSFSSTFCAQRLKNYTILLIFAYNNNNNYKGGGGGGG